MNDSAASVIVNGFLKGAFDVFDAMLSASFSHEVDDINIVTPELLEDVVGRYQVCLCARIENNLGSVALLYSTPDAARISAMVLESEPKETLDDEDAGVLQEVADPALGGGVTNVMERFEHEVVQLEEVKIIADATQNIGELQELMGDSPVLGTFSFNSGDDFSGEAAFLYSSVLEELAPDDLGESDDTGLADVAAATLSPDEMNDILSGFEAPDEPEGEMPVDMGMPAAAAGGQKAPENLDLVLDIRLEATARLGRVEMPVGNILELGPGSIVEVGHLVDEPVELLINNKLIARGDVVVVDEKFGLRITEIISPRERIESLR